MGKEFFRPRRGPDGVRPHGRVAGTTGRRSCPERTTGQGKTQLGTGRLKFVALFQRVMATPFAGLVAAAFHSPGPYSSGTITTSPGGEFAQDEAGYPVCRCGLD